MNQICPSEHTIFGKISIETPIKIPFYQTAMYILREISYQMFQQFAHAQKTKVIPYSTKCWWCKTLANRPFQSFGEENVGKFTIATISYYSESGIQLGKILANDDRFAKFAKVFPHQSFALYSSQLKRSITYKPCQKEGFMVTYIQLDGMTLVVATQQYNKLQLSVTHLRYEW